VSLSDELRAELAAIAPRRRCDRLAELSGLFHVAGSVHLRGRGEVTVHLDLASSGAARRAFSLLRDCGVASELRTYRRRAFEQGTRYQLHVAVGPGARRLLHEAGILDREGGPLERPPRRVTGRSCCRRAYLRGGLLGGGSLSGPRDPHLEIRTAGVEGARFVAGLATQEGAHLGVADRGGHAAAYAKSSEAIADLLAAAGASDLVLALEEHAVVAATRGAANRLANADHANLVRASHAAHAQLQAVRRLQEDGLLAGLSAELQEVAGLRLRHPTLSLAELARKCEPPATKSAAHRRLRRLQELAGLR
jgi:DNA-binding protein WhiA